MGLIRRFIAQRHLAALLCAATLLLRLLVPTGYMVGSEQGRVTIELCSGMAAKAMTMTMPGMTAGGVDDGRPVKHGKSGHGGAEMPCAFSGLSAATLGAVDPIQLAALILFVMAAGLCPAMLPPAVRHRHLRPPLRGPPTSV